MTVLRRLHKFSNGTYFYMKNFFSIITLSLAIGSGYATIIPVKDTVIYKNKNAPIPARIEDLLKRMTLREKVEQLENRAAGKTSQIDQIFKGESFGCTHEMNMSAQDCADMYQQLQTYMLKKTRLGIPLLTAAEGIEGVLQNNCTIFPQELAQGSTFNPGLIKRMTTAAGEEAKVIGIHQILSPVLDNPLTLHVHLNILWLMVRHQAD
jgi:beta-glucosidase